jgi:hypothetical protein
MERLSTKAALITLAILATVSMFLFALVASLVGPGSVYFLWFVCLPFECILLLFWLPVMFVTQALVLHTLRLSRTDTEHYYQMVRERREIDLQLRRTQLQLYRHRLPYSRYRPRRVYIKPRPPGDLSANGC